MVEFITDYVRRHAKDPYSKQPKGKLGLLSKEKSVCSILEDILVWNDLGSESDNPKNIKAGSLPKCDSGLKSRNFQVVL